MTKPIILHLIVGLEIGGTEMMLLRTLPLLQEQYSNHVICLRGPGPIGEALQQKGIPVHYLRLRHSLDVTVIKQFGALIRRLRPDILVTYLIHADLFGRIVGRWYGVRRIVSSQRGSLLQWEFLRIVDRWTTVLVDFYTIQTEVAKRMLTTKLQLPSTKCRVIPNPLDPTPYGQRRARSSVKGIPENGQIITCVSNLRQGKGHEYLLQAFEKIHAKYPTAWLVLVGDGEQRVNLMRQIASYDSRKCVLFLGERHDIPAILAVTDIFVLPTLAEGMSNALLEAMAARLPIVTTDIPENREIVEHNKTAWLVLPATVEPLVTALQNLLDNQVTRQRLGEHAYQRVVTYHAPARIVSLYQELFTLMMSSYLPHHQQPQAPGRQRVSILVAVHNGAHTLDRCFKSIASQTYRDYDIVCVNDVSTDSTPALIDQWQHYFGPSRFLIIHNKQQLGLTRSLNAGLAYCRGEYVARIDADDTWAPQKLSRQIDFLDTHPKVGVVGSYYVNYGRTSTTRIRLPVSDEAIRRTMLRLNPFGHSCVVIRKALLDAANGYDPLVYYGQDFDLWLRIAPHTHFYNLPEFLCFREVSSGISATYGSQQMIQAARTMWRYLHRHHLSWWRYTSIALPLTSALFFALRALVRRSLGVL